MADEKDPKLDVDVDEDDDAWRDKIDEVDLQLADDVIGEDGGATSRGRKSFVCTDTGNAERMIAAHGESIRYCGAWKVWLVWDGQRWERDVRGRVQNYAKLTARAILGEAARCTNDGVRGALSAWAKKSESRKERVSMVACAQSEPAVSIHFTDLDRHDDLLNVKNGTLDLRTGKLRPHRREDLLTKLAPVAYDENATAPIWEAFLARVIPDAEVRTFVQRFAGCCLTGDVSDRVFVFFHGRGRNGKSVLLRVLRTMLGDYAIVAAPDLLMMKKSEGAHPTEIADLFGARLVCCQEVAKDRRFNEQRIKELTGNEGAIKARRMNEDFWEFPPTFKLAIAGNHEPVVADETDSIWDRLRKVPFKVRIADGEVDKLLVQKLRAELPGVLAWAVRGCVDWREHGLPAPTAVAAATDAYRTAEDVVGRFLADCCAIHPDARVTSKQLLDAAKEWSEANGEREVRHKDIAGRLQTEGCFSRKTNKARGWSGVRLLEPAEIKARDAESDGVTGGDVTLGIVAPISSHEAKTPDTASPRVTCHNTRPDEEFFGLGCDDDGGES